MIRTSFIEPISLMRQWSLGNDFDFPSSLAVVGERCYQERDRNILVEENVHMVACTLKLRHIPLTFQVRIHRSSGECMTTCLAV